MLTAYGHKDRLRQGPLTDAAFRLFLLSTLNDLGMARVEPEPGRGFLVAAPIPAAASLSLQIDLLAETWHKQRSRKMIEGNLPDAAIVYPIVNTSNQPQQQLKEHACMVWKQA